MSFDTTEYDYKGIHLIKNEIMMMMDNILEQHINYYNHGFINEGAAISQVKQIKELEKRRESDEELWISQKEREMKSKKKELQEELKPYKESFEKKQEKKREEERERQRLEREERKEEREKEREEKRLEREKERERQP